MILSTLTKSTLLSFAMGSLAACGSDADPATEQAAERMENRVELQADQNEVAAAQTPTAQVALGMTELQLMDADLVAADGTDLGDVELVRRDAGGTVTGLLVEVDDADPDRWVVVPIDGLTARPDGDDMDVQTTMTAADLAALPDAEMPAPTR